MVARRAPDLPRFEHPRRAQVRRHVGQVVLLNTVEEWKIEKPHRQRRGPRGRRHQDGPARRVDHPFHIHINPFQIVEFFRSQRGAARTRPTNTSFAPPTVQGQCPLDIDKPETWKPCDPQPKTT